MTQPSPEPSEPSEPSERPATQPDPSSAPPPPPPPVGGQPYGGVPGYQPYPGAQPPLAPSDARMWAIFAHLGGTFLSFIVPLVIYLVFKDRDPFVRRHSAQALNFHLTLFIAYIISAILIFVLVGLILIPLLAIASLVLTIMAAVAANDGRDWVYPGAIQFVS